MAFQKKTWKNRISENPLRRIITNVTTGVSETVDVQRYEGIITEQGDAFSAANMNDLEDRIAAGMGAGDVLIANTEATSTASQAYTKGQYLVYNSILYRATAAIAQGASLVVGTNIEAVKLGNELSDHLVVNGNGFYFDYQNGEYGYNTSPLRGADTFSPFKGTPSTCSTLVTGLRQGNSYTLNEDYPIVIAYGYSYDTSGYGGGCKLTINGGQEVTLPYNSFGHGVWYNCKAGDIITCTYWIRFTNNRIIGLK